MPAEAVERRLAAILAADIAGYSRLVGLDEEGTLARLRSLRREIIDPTIADHRGRIVKTTGDGMLVEFASVVDAVRCAVAVQRATAARETELPADSRIEFRVGIHVGDIVVEGEDILGDGVNIAARLEGIAEPGGLCISSAVYDQIRDKLALSFDDMGEQNVKNIVRPVHVYGIRAAAVGLPTTSAGKFADSRDRYKPLRWLAAACIVGVGIFGGAIWWVSNHPASPGASVTTSVPAKTTRADSRLSLLVLPFSNLSNDPDQEYFADGITEDVTTDLSRIAGSFVIARNTAFTFKGKPVNVKQIGRELGVQYILEGSVRRSADRVQVNAQLIDADSGAHVWADRFDTDRRNIADAQAEITGRLARTLHLELLSDAGRRIERERATDPNARDLVMRGWALWYRPASAANREEALRFFERALELDRESLDARIGIALILAAKIDDGFSEAVQQDGSRAEKLLLEALEREPDRSMAHTAMGVLRRAQDRLDEAQAELKTAIALDRNNAFAYFLTGSVLMRGGQPEPCIAYVEKALTLSPRETLPYAQLGKCNLFLGHFDDALNFFRRAQAANPRVWWVRLKLAGTLGLLGKTDEAMAEAAEMISLNPKMNSVTRIRDLKWYRNPRFQELHDKTIILGLRSVGFPEETQRADDIPR